MATATAMHHTGINLLRSVSDKAEAIKGGRQRRLHTASLRYHDPQQLAVATRGALKAIGRVDLIGSRPEQVVPAHQPPGTGNTPSCARGRAERCLNLANGSKGRVTDARARHFCKDRSMMKVATVTATGTPPTRYKVQPDVGATDVGGEGRGTRDIET